MIRISLNREPVAITLTGPYAGVVVTLKRLTSVDYAEAHHASQAILRDDAALLPLLAEHELLPAKGIKGWKRLKTDDPHSHAAYLTGIAVWLLAVECGLRGITDWAGIRGDDGQAVAVNREALEVLMLDEWFQREVMGELEKAARILSIEGEP